MKHINFISNTAYEGGQNISELEAVCKKYGYKIGEWCTFLQAKNNGYKVNKGSHGVHIFKGYGEFTEKDQKSGKLETVKRPLGWATVFNKEQLTKVK